MREIRGIHVLAFTSAAFALIIGVNVLMAWKAISTFPGLEVANSYVASQEFDTAKAAQVGLGWTLTPGYEGGEIRLAFTDGMGQPVTLGSLTVLLGRTTEARDDSTPVFALRDGVYVADAALDPGKWMLQVAATAADGTEFNQRLGLYVKAGS
jgi:nitrogen fixation protein FixH